MLNPKSLGLAGGILWGAAIVLMTYLNMFFGYGSMWSLLIADVYLGYEVTFLGSIIGFIWGFFDAFVGFFLLAWFYNKFNS
jgi:hypothetical protein